MALLRAIGDAIGGTPLVRLARLSATSGAELWAKLEGANPGGSVKDRIARAMIDDAEARGALRPGATIVEPTSGNTGIALAMLAAERGYRCVLTMPEAMSRERLALLRAYGAEVVLTPSPLMRAAVEQAEVLARTTPGAVMLRQFENPANPLAHERTTAEEIWRDAEGRLDAFVAGIGTGGTITGVARVLRRRAPAVRIVGVEPARAALLTRGPVGPHGIQGIGAGFVPEVLDVRLVDEVLPVDDAEAVEAARRVAREDGVLGGFSSGAALAAALRLAARPAMQGRRIVIVFPDGGERYATAPLFRAMTDG
ncbi:MAG TPA: cysteine synthase A [Candidatus Binatia bacterium]|nr:cysteine synthase A [Candidatus Binatia bacterium]